MLIDWHFAFCPPKRPQKWCAIIDPTVFLAKQVLPLIGCLHQLQWLSMTYELNVWIKNKDWIVCSFGCVFLLQVVCTTNSLWWCWYRRLWTLISDSDQIRFRLHFPYVSAYMRKMKCSPRPQQKININISTQRKYKISLG